MPTRIFVLPIHSYISDITLRLTVCYTASKKQNVEMYRENKKKWLRDLFMSEKVAERFVYVEKMTERFVKYIK